METLSEFIKYIRKEILECPFDNLTIAFYDDEISFKLYDEEDVCIIYNGDIDDIQCEGLTMPTNMDTLKDVYGIMQAIKENHKILDNMLEKR